MNLQDLINEEISKIRDKYLRIKVRYTGNDLAIIYALRTMFTVSYA
jgi:hypothetical protein